MPTLADSLVSSTARPLNVRMRPDLAVRETRYQGTPYWVIKDPVGLNYFRFQEEEYNILLWLDGHSSLDELKRRFERQFAPQKIGLDELGRLIGTLHRSNLVIADLPGQGPQLMKRRREKRRQKLLGTLTNILAIRFKGIDPERILTAMLPYTRWFFSKWTATLCILFGLSALLLVAVQFDVFRAKLPTFHQFFAAQNWIWLAVAMAITKVIHEFGHGLSCKYFGGECHEMGAMLLVFTPCLYCNVSDSWMLPSKWQRAFIGAAGMYVELVIASIATYIWWFSDPGTIVNQLALSTMFVCSVSTLMFNANPLMRYDGYYILSDLTEIPNLRQKASTILHRKAGKWCLGLKEPDDPFLPERHQSVLRSVLGRLGDLHVAGDVLNSLLLVQSARAISAANHRTNPGRVFARQSGGHAALQARPFLLSAWEDRSSEEAASICHAWRAGRGRGGDRIHPAAVPHRDADGSACAIQTLCMCP